MNIQTRDLKVRRRKVLRRSEVISAKVKVLVGVNVIIALITFFTIANYRISLNQKISDIEHESAVCQKELHNLEREIQSLKIQKEEFSSWRRIKGKILQLGLNLRMPEPYQLQALDLKHVDTVIYCSSRSTRNQLAMQ